MEDPRGQERFLARTSLASIKSYEEGRFPFQRLVADLKSRISAMKSFADPQWADELWSSWFRLEIVNAVTIDQHREPDQDEAREINEALGVLRLMLTEHPEEG